MLVPGNQNDGFLDGADGNLSGDNTGNRTFSITSGIVSYRGTHKVGTNPAGRSAVQLLPFDDTTNNGGVYVVAVCRSDASGPSDCKYDTFKVGASNPKDSTPPYLAIIKPSDGGLVGGVVDFSAVGSDDNFESMACAAGSFSLGSSNEGVVETQFDTHAVLDGLLTMSCQAWDKSGNLSSAAVAVDVDNTPPELTIYSPAGGASISGLATLHGDAIDAHPGITDCSIDGKVFYSTEDTALWSALNTLDIIDGTSTLHCNSTDKVGNSASIDSNIIIDNMSIKVMPQSLNLTSMGKDTSVTVQVAGVNVSLLVPITDHDLKLSVPGGFDVPVNVSFGSRGSIDSLMIKFDRAKLIDSLRIGLATGSVVMSQGVTLTLKSGNREIGSDWIKLLD